ncbi:hypothetical protein HGM15179_021050 [Zosterops borbonicus]|uniref:SH3 domain-containing protein n=1 Tax=Zosterops borbonicus TaxID=364589 RepID=A0A8K1D6L9_9PASS|nr:hypothetical protein HGM15179_021050 [Zosterops borbonicus]
MDVVHRWSMDWLDWCVNMAWLGFVRQQYLEVIVTDLVPTAQGEMTENGSHQLVVKARFNFKQTNEDELSVNKGDIIYVTRVEEGGWWEGTLNGKTGWFPSNYVREIKSTGINGMDAHHHSVESDKNCMATGHGPCFGP